LDAYLWQGVWSSSVERFFRPTELCVYGDALPQLQKDLLLRGSRRNTPTPVLVCPRSWRPLGRVLVLHDHQLPGNCFLENASATCRVLRVEPVVLTVARTERQARQYQRAAEELFAARGLLADFDFVVGFDVRTAVASVARWRRCSHVVLEKTRATSWWRWLRRDTMALISDLTGALTFLALPGADLPAPTGEPTNLTAPAALTLEQKAVAR
jgi:K+-sensing histidine kinase KdpD